MLKANSSNVSKEVLNKLIDACLPPGTPRNFVVNIRTSPGAYCASGRASGTHGGRVLVTLGTISQGYFMDGVPGKGYIPGIAIGNRAEALLFVLAHELRHAWQRTHKSDHVWGSRGRFSERDADAWGLRMLRRARREPELRALLRQVPMSDEKRNAALKKAKEKKKATENHKLAGLPKSIQKLVPEGCEFEGDEISAPKHHKFRCNDCHYIIVHEGAEGRQGAIDDLKSGIYECDKDCDCRDEE